MTAAHSKLGASSMYRWATCAGSVRQSAGIASRSSKYAEEGTAAHALAEHCLSHGYNARRGFEPPTEFTDAVQVYLDAVRAEVKVNDTLQIEQRFDLSEVHPGCFGTADAVVWQPKTQTLIVFDYKHGAGIPVNVEGNPQLQYYALGALLASGYPAKRVRMVVVQPRCDHPAGPVRSWEVDAIDLIDFRADLKQYAEATERPDAPLVPGDHCRFCPAAGLCPGLMDRAQSVAKLEFGPALSYDPAKLRLALDSRPTIQAWLKALDEFAYAEAEAGRTPPGYKLVAKRAIRKWRDEGAAIDALQLAGVNASTMMETALKSPAQLEKVVDKKLIADLVTSESSGHVLAPESDKRPPVKAAAKDEFTAIAA
jgi:hypothetical protein